MSARPTTTPAWRSSAPCSGSSPRPTSPAAGMPATTRRCGRPCRPRSTPACGSGPTRPIPTGPDSAAARWRWRRPTWRRRWPTQIGALIEVAASLGATVCSVKPHGALYGEVGGDAATFDALLGVRRRPVWPGHRAGAPLRRRPRWRWAERAGVAVLEEGFADRAYARGRRVGGPPAARFGLPRPGAGGRAGARAGRTGDGGGRRRHDAHVRRWTPSACTATPPMRWPWRRRCARALDAAGIAVAAPPARRPA